MKIKAITAIRKIKAGTAWVVGKMSTGSTYPEGYEYWIINDAAKMETHHVLVDDSPNLDKVTVDPISQAAAAIGRKGGSVKSDAKTAAAQANAKKGGVKARIDIEPMLARIEDSGGIFKSKYFREKFPSEWRKACRLKVVRLWTDPHGNRCVSVNRGKSVVNSAEKSRLA